MIFSMDKIFNNRLSAILSVLCLGLSLCGCALSKDDPDLPPLVGCDFGYSLDGMESVSTRTVLTGSDIEDRITCITLAAYGAEGVLSSSRHFEDDEVQSMSLDLVKGEVYDIFALVNMGDMTDELPSFVKDVSSIGYDVPSYSEVDSRGLPMSGSLSGFIPGDRPSAVVPLRRLFAKVTAELALAYDDASITDVYIRNLNGTLSVFGESAASSSADILSDVEYSSASGSYGSYVFYVPENRQGVIGSASDSHGKNPDLDQAIAAVSDRLTYMEVGVALDGRDYAGEVTYRSYLGSDAVKDFDVVGNKRYVWRVTYLEDNLQYDDWKVETGDMNVFDYVLEVVPGELAVNVGETGTLNAYFYKLTDGVRDSGTDVTSSAQWNSQKTSVASVSKGQVLGLSKGESVVTATYDGVSATSRVVVDDVVTYELEVVPDNASISWNETVDLKALFWTVVNGERTESEDVTEAAQWSSENSSVASVMLGSVLGRKGGSSVITASYSDASGNTYSASSLVTVGDVVTYELVVTPETASLKWNESVTLKAVYNTIVNGQVSSSVDVTSKAQWSSSAVSVATVSAGKVTGVSGGTATVTASYEGRSDSAEVTVGNVVTYSLVVSPESASVNVGSSVSLSAVLKTYTNGKETASEDVTSKAGWSSSPSGLVTVSSGSVKGEKAGIATVTASYSVNGTSVSGSASVTVSDVIGYELEITPSSSEVKVGSSVALTAKYYKLTNGQRDGGTDVTSKVTWSSSPSGLVTVTSGSVTGVKAGTATVNASYTANGGTVNASATVVVSDVIGYELEITPSSSEVKVGSSVALVAKYYKLTNGNRDGGTDVTSKVTWSSSPSGLVTVSSGSVKGVKAGTATVNASYTANGGTVSASATVTVSDVVGYELEITPKSSEVNVGSTVALVAKYYKLTNGQRDGGTDVTSKVTWSSSPSGLVTVSSGSVKGVKAGTATVTASYTANGGTVNASASVKVNDVITYDLVVAPETATVKWNETVSLKATYRTLTNGSVTSTQDVTSSAQWTTSSSSVATVSAGVVTGVSGGKATITAKYSGKAASAAVTVTDVVTYSLSVSPQTASVKVGSSVSLSAVVKTYTNGKETSSEDVTSKAGWSSSPSGLVTVSSGSVKGVKAGTATVTASYTVNGTAVSGTATVTVSDVIGYELEITPKSSEVNVGSSVALVAKYYKLTNGQRDGGTDVTSKVTWSSSPSGLVTISSGSVTGVKSGTATVTGSYTANGGTVNASASVKVNDVITYDLVVAPETATVNWNETVSLTATYRTLTNGSVTSTQDVTSSAEWSTSSASVATVSRGSVKGVKGGTATITARYSGKSDTATVTVKDVVTYDLVVAPETATVNWNETVSLKATYRTITNGSVTSTQDVTSSAEWSTSSASVATVSRGSVKGVKGGTATITAKYSGKSDTATITVNDVHDYELEVTPSSASIDYGEQVSLTATYWTVVNGVRTTSSDVTRSATWKSSNSSVASVSGGTVTGEDGGSATITATYQGCSDTASISVRDVTTYEVEVTPASATVSWNETVSLKATEYTVVNGERTSSIDITSSAIWSTADRSVATVSKGVVTGVSGGTVNITATYGDESDYAVITVRDVTTYELEVTPSSASIDYGEQVSLTATYWTVVNGVRSSSRNVTGSATWRSDDYTVASVSGGTVTGEGGGSATVTATYDGLSDSALITVRNVTTYELEVTPSSASIDYGEQVSLTATYWTVVNGVRSSSRNVTGSATWRSDDYTVASVSSGTVTGEGGGTATITATYEGCSDTARITVSNVVTYRLEVSPSSSTIFTGESVDLEATYYKITNGVSDSGTDVTSSASWSVVTGSSVVSVSRGTVTGRTAGSATVKATYSGVSDEASVTVQVPVPSSVTLSETSSFYLMVSDYAQTRQLSASASMSDGSTVTSGLSWSSSSSSVAKVSSSGLVSAVGYGTATITASYSAGGVTKSASVTVRVSKLAISPANSTVEYGGTQQYSLTLTTYNGTTQNPSYSCDWNVSDPSVAVQRSTGSLYFNAVGSGTTTITASYDSTYGQGEVSAILTVTDAVTYKVRIAVTGGNEVAVGGTLQLGVRKYTDTYTNGVLTSEDTSGTAISVTDVTWSVYSGSSYISVSSSGVVTGTRKSGSILPKVKAVLKSDTTVSAVKEVAVVDNSAVAPDPGWDDDDNIEL